jgi:N-dimethylarginine dimethylaminohydrolase
MALPARLSDDACVGFSEDTAQQSHCNSPINTPPAPVQVIHTLNDFQSLQWDLLSVRPEPERILMCSPEYFDIVDVKNSFMEGQIGQLDKEKALLEWQALRHAFESTGHEILVIPGAEGLEDMVFCANQVLPGKTHPSAKPYIVLSRMRHPSRQQEVPYFKAWFEAQGYQSFELPESVSLFEGQGDALWHPGKQLLWGGYGHRTTKEAYTALAALLNVPVIVLELPTPDYYHLDTAMSIVSAESVMIYPGAFSQDGLALIRAAFSTVMEVSQEEAANCFTCNAHALQNKKTQKTTVILHQGAQHAIKMLRDLGFEVIEVDTTEFMKSGGSVFCMKMMIY